MRKIIYSVLAFTLFGCSIDKQPVDYIDPFIGTGFHGHTYPGATVPFGAVQLSPDTRLGNWDACSGYHYSDNTILGFSHTHLSGTGCIDLGDILFHPTTKEAKLQKSGYFFEPLAFSHKDETASAGYYSVNLKEEGIKVELTATTYVGMHRYTYKNGKEQNIIVDLAHVLGGDAIDLVLIEQRGENAIAGVRRTHGWTPNQKIHFVAEFSEKIQTANFLNDRVVELKFGPSTGKPLIAKVGLSLENEIQARANLSIAILNNDGAGVGSLDFDGVHLQAREQWNQAVSDITVEGSEADKKTFYTAQYHAKVVPNIVSDMRDKAKRYSTFSLWDTYRAWNPLMTLTSPDLVNDMINSYLEWYDANGELPLWSLSTGETYCMIGYHTASVIADAFQKGIRGWNAEKALAALKVSSNINRKASDFYVQTGFIPADIKIESVSCLLEYAYDDWCIAQLANALGHKDDFQEYTRRAYSYINVFDGYSKFFRGKKANGNWDELNEYIDQPAYTEGTAWHYRFSVPHDIHGLIQLFGSKQIFADKLDSLFIIETKLETDLKDITGLIGQYAHGNEPSHHIAYLFNYIGKPWKTQELTRRIIKEMYLPTPEGIIGNEDCGQMSAWYILSSLGLYAVCPGSNEFALTSPAFPKATIHLGNGKTLTIKANNPAQNIYINKVTLNGVEIENNYVTYAQLMAGGTLDFTLSDQPNYTRGIAETAYPYSMTKGQVVSIPYTTKDLDLFVGTVEVDLASATPDAKIYYTLNGTEPSEKYTLYTSPIPLNTSKTIKAKAYKDGYAPSRTFSIDATLAIPSPTVSAAGKEHGVNYRYYEGEFHKVADINERAVVARGVLPEPSIKGAKSEDHFGFIFDGIIEVPEEGIYDFMTATDDGSVLYIDGKRVVNNDGSHAAYVVKGRVALKKGFHAYKILYIEDFEGESFKWGWRKPSATKLEAIPAEVLYVR
ncbi:alpha-1 2-mannosidase [Bacteroidia bacterium]|nr:alpha-1 2-mannosidase [Bacteroidia bacterium]